MKEEFKSRMYQMYELRDEIKASINNLNDIISKQNQLSTIITNSEMHENFKDFVVGLEKQNKEYEAQVKMFEKRLAIAELLISEVENNNTHTDKIVSLTLEVLGATHEELTKQEA